MRQKQPIPHCFIFALAFASLWAQPATYQVIDLGPQEFNIPGYIRFSTGQNASPQSLNNNFLVGLNAVSNNGVVPDPVGGGPGTPFGAGNTAAIWDRGFLRDMRWSLPGSVINNPHLGYLHPFAKVSVSSAGHVAAECRGASFTNPGLTNIGPDRCSGQGAVMFHPSTRTWRMIGSLSDDASQSPIVRSTRKSRALGVNWLGMAVGASEREPGFPDTLMRPRAFHFADANPAALIGSNLSSDLGALPSISAYDSSGAFIGFTQESVATAISDTGLIVGYTAPNANLQLPPSIGMPPICPAAFFPQAHQVQWIPQRFTVGGAPSYISELGPLCDTSAIPRAVSPSGHIGGSYDRPSQNRFGVPFVLVGGSRIDVPIPPGADGEVLGINSLGHAVGVYRLAGETVPFLWRGGPVIDLRTRVPQFPPGFISKLPLELKEAVSINDSGAIVANARQGLRNISVLLLEEPMCTVSVEFQHLPTTIDQAGVPHQFQVHVRQNQGNCKVAPVGEIRIFRNDALQQTVRITDRPVDPMAAAITTITQAFLAGLNTIRAEYSGNGLYASHSVSQQVNVGPSCLASPSSASTQRGGFVLVPGNPEFFSQRLTVINNTGAPLPAYTTIQILGLTPGVQVMNPSGLVNHCTSFAPANTPYLVVTSDVLAPGARAQVNVQFLTPNRQTPIVYSTNILTGGGLR